MTIQLRTFGLMLPDLHGKVVGEAQMRLACGGGVVFQGGMVSATFLNDPPVTALN
jgi:hypothetical protein